MEEVSKNFVKVLLSALIRLEFYEDSELSFEEIIDQADGRSSLSRDQLIIISKKYLQVFSDLSVKNPLNLTEYLEPFAFSVNEASAIQEIWAEEKGLILRKLLHKREIE